MAEPETKNCSRVIFLVRFLIFANIAKISDSVDFEQPQLRFKNYRNKNHGIFRKPWTPAFRWHTLDTSETLAFATIIFIERFSWLVGEKIPVDSLLKNSWKWTAVKILVTFQILKPACRSVGKGEKLLICWCNEFFQTILFHQLYPPRLDSVPVSLFAF